MIDIYSVQFTVLHRRYKEVTVSPLVHNSITTVLINTHCNSKQRMYKSIRQIFLFVKGICQVLALLYQSMLALNLSTQILIQKIIRLCTNSHYLAHSATLFAILKTLTVYDIHRLHKATFMFQYTNGLLPDIFSKYFTKSSAIHSIGTRSSDLYRHYNFRPDLARNTIRRQGPQSGMALI